MSAAITSKRPNRHSMSARLGETWKIVRRPAMVGAPMAATSVGWALLWADGLGLVNVGPAWIPAMLFGFGITLIPLAARSAAREARTERQPGVPTSQTLQLPQEYRGHA
jgi:hypothetical protein